MEAHLWRLAECGRKMRLDKASRFEAVILFKPANIFYFTGSGRLISYVIVTKYAAAGVGVPLYAEARAKEGASFDHIAAFGNEDEMFASISHYFKFFKISSGAVGVEFDYLARSRSDYLQLSGALPDAVELKDCSAFISGLRTVKEDAEIDLVRAAAKAADAGMAAAVEALEPGMTAGGLVTLAERAMKHAGAQKFWRTCVYLSSPLQLTSIAESLGPDEVLRVESGRLVQIELNPAVDGYYASICRTVCAGEPSAQQMELFHAHLQAQNETISMVHEGVTVSDLENGFDKHLAAGGLAPIKFEPLVKGIGIEPAEQPFPKGHGFFYGGAFSGPLMKNSVLAVGGGAGASPAGICIRDTLVVGASGCEVLTQYQRPPDSS